MVPVRDVVALDGPSGTGKSTVARALATELGLRYLNTGAMYRAVAWAVLAAAVDPTDAERVAGLARRIHLEITTDPYDQRVEVDGTPVEGEIRSPEVTTAVSPVSATPEVRRLLVARQRELIGAGGIVVEGRDIGTVVAPDAELKVYLTASHDTRAERRARQDGTAPEQFGVISEALRSRDAYDSGRTLDPLRPAEDAIHIDTTMLSVYDVVKRLVDIARDRGIAQAIAGAGDIEQR